MSIEIGDGGLGYIYLGDILIAGGKGGGSTISTFDFQNDGDLGWTNDSSTSSGVCSIVSNQGWQITRSGQTAMQGQIIPPSSVYKGTLKKYTIYAYKSGNAAVGFTDIPQTSYLEYGRDTTKLIVNGSTIANQSLSGEITVEVTFEDGGDTKIKLSDGTNTYNYTSTGTADGFKVLWLTKKLYLLIGRRGSGTNVYIRKVVIETE